MSQPYHKYVFDTSKREFVGEFEEMYRNEGVEGYDSWFQEDLRSLDKQLSLAILGRFNFQRILDLGCGKGTFTHLLKKANNEVIGIDISDTAIARARVKYPDIEFRVAALNQLASLSNKAFDLVVAMEVLSYLSDWREVLRTVSQMTRYLYIALYVPPEPIGFVKSSEELTSEVAKRFHLETKLQLNENQVMLLSRTREPMPS